MGAGAAEAPTDDAAPGPPEVVPDDEGATAELNDGDVAVEAAEEAAKPAKVEVETAGTEPLVVAVALLLAVSTVAIAAEVEDGVDEVVGGVAAPRPNLKPPPDGNPNEKPEDAGVLDGAAAWSEGALPARESEVGPAAVEGDSGLNEKPEVAAAAGSAAGVTVLEDAPKLKVTLLLLFSAPVPGPAGGLIS